MKFYDTQADEDILVKKAEDIKVQEHLKTTVDGQEDRSQEVKSPSSLTEGRKMPQAPVNSLMKILTEVQQSNLKHHKSGSISAKSKAKTKPKSTLKALPGLGKPSVASKSQIFNCHDIREFCTGSASQTDSSNVRGKAKWKVSNKFSTEHNSDSGKVLSQTNYLG